jgi:hypothetical protein
MPVGASSHEPPGTKSGRADCALYRRRQPGQRLDQPAGKRRMRARRREGKVGWRREAGQRLALRGPEAAEQQARRGGSWEGSEEGRKEQSTE